jgi:hypothetical protein
MALPRLLSFVAAAMFVPAIAAADVVRFAAVDAASVKIHANNYEYRELVLTGSVAGAPRTQTYLADRDEHDLQQQCLRLATLVLSKPGKYQLDVEYTRWDDSGGPLIGCTLVRTP